MAHGAVTITGSQGFIGTALRKRLGREYKVYPNIRKDIDYLFLFGSPSSVTSYNEQPGRCFRSTINDFIDAIEFCRDNNIKLIYPSSATVQNKNTSYARCKACLEEIHQSYDVPALGLRIFAGYGPYEGHKGDYASIVYQFCKQMGAGIQPVIYGDGEQTRDFVYIDDIVGTIVDNLGKEGIIDIGTGENSTFNGLVGLINKILGTEITPRYVDKPKRYVQETICDNPLEEFVPLEQGIIKILERI